jgi:hypothetical protein
MMMMIMIMIMMIMMVDLLAPTTRGVGSMTVKAVKDGLSCFYHTAF